MYADAMTGIHKTLVSRSMGSNLLYTPELVPERNAQGNVCVVLGPSPALTED